MKNGARIAFAAFLLAAVADIWFSYSGDQQGRLVTKPLLMPLLMIGYALSAPRPFGQFQKLLLAGLFFSWLGDILLMFEDDAGLFFIGGLLFFLTTHVLYIRYFAATRSSSLSFFRKRPLLFVAVLAYTIELLYVLWPHLGPMKVPVIIYGLIISIMLSMALWQYGKLSSKTAWLFIIGALLFVTSDSMLAIDKFKQHFSSASVMVMSTYVLAQFLIVLGSLRHLGPAK